MISEIHFFLGLLLLGALLTSASIGYAVSGIAYPGAGAPFLPDGPVRKLVYGDVAFLAICGALRLMGF